MMNIMNNVYFGPDTEISKYPVATAEHRGACGYGGNCGTCRYALCAGLDYLTEEQYLSGQYVQPQRCTKIKTAELC